MNSRYFHRITLCICLAVPAASAQVQLHFGVAAGVPLTDTLTSTANASTNPTGSFLDRYNSVTKRLLIGPALRVDLTHGLGIEFDALYQRINYDHTLITSRTAFFSRSIEQATANRWQFPLLIQYRWSMSKTKPFVEAGPSISWIANSRSTIRSVTSSTASSLSLVPNSSSTSTISGPGGTWAGVTMGAGVDLPFFRGHLRPEFRFSHWFLPYTGSATGQVGAAFIGVRDFLSSQSVSFSALRPNQNEAVFLLGLTF